MAPFCMEGYRYLGYCSRIPGEEIDKLVSYKEERPTHTIVLRYAVVKSICDILSGD